jgi:hypothetical protein
VAHDDVGAHRHPNDVFVFVKAYMGSRDLHQPPLLVLPVARARLVQPLPSTIPVPRRPLDENRRKELYALADTCQDQLQLPSAAQYLRKLANSDQAIVSLAPFHWVGQVPAQRLRVTESANPHFPHLPEPTWQLRVRFRSL